MALVVMGLLVIALYAILAAFTTVGDPTDIGGGLILLLGYLLTGGGVRLVGKDRPRHRARPKDQ